ncbi:MAG: ROK family protein, partial [Abditibacteriota bacterium]|nr:ROK family protein [Abditibacteriota bacterium]
GEKLGEGLSLLIDILNPEVIVIGSVFARNVDLFKPAAMRAIERETISYSRAAVRLEPAALGDSIGDYAAICLAMEAEKK